MANYLMVENIIVNKTGATIISGFINRYVDIVLWADP